MSKRAKRNTPEYRVGSGYDVHRLGDPGPLLIGGVEIRSNGGALGHSDADVVMHAIVDALLGATAGGDIGQHYPNTDPANRDANSARFVAQTIEDLGNSGWVLVNADITIVLERPRIEPFAETIQAEVAKALGVDPSQVGIKAKTNEGLDSIGAGNAVACHTTVLVMREPLRES